MPIRITSKFNGYRHSGRQHPSEPTIHPDGTFTDEEITAMKADSILTVEVIPAQLVDEGVPGEPAQEPPPGDPGNASEPAPGKKKKGWF
jgi:hypothetical protein